MSTHFDIVVIGAGPAGYVCAIRAAQLGFSVAIVDKRPELGGTCLNVGCIPSKALLESSHKFHEAQHGFAAHGIQVPSVTLDMPAMQARKAGVVQQLTSGIGMLMKKNKIAVFTATGKVLGAGRVGLSTGETLTAKHIVLATGSTPVELPFAKFDHAVILDSTDALSLPAVPKHLVVIGAGVIGLEMGSVWQRLGAKVTVIDVAERPVAIMDADVGMEALKIFSKQGLVFKLGAKVQGIAVAKNEANVTVQLADGSTETLQADKVLVSVGRRPYSAELGLADAGVQLDAKGFVATDAHFATNVPGIYAIGDCRPGPMLAHKGEEEGVALAEHLAGQHVHINELAIPWVVYTHPELSGVGYTEAEAQAKFGAVKVGKFKFAANGRALAVGETGGFVKVLAHPDTDELLGVHIVGHNASELIAEAAVLLEFKATAEDLARCVHAHPTLSEAVKEAALASQGRALHS